jgi:UDP-GlcNAc3NAcA epimerase
MQIVTVVGARPQFIKAGHVSRACAVRGIDEHLVHTGQHYDLNMSDIFFDALGLKEPDFHLGIGSGGHGAQTGKMLAAIEDILLDLMPDALLVYGDTNSTLAGALAAAKLHVPVVHVEAGLRSFNRRMPEEINRVMTDHISSLLFCPTDAAVQHLAAEGVTDGVHMVGDVMKDALDHWKQRSDGQSQTLSAYGVEPGRYYLATVHRAENVDNPDRLAGIMYALSALDLPVILPVHPRTRKALAAFGDTSSPAIRMIEPIGYLEMLALEGSARKILTDSGGVQKEAYMLGVPCVTLRDETEWTETVDAGWNVIVGADAPSILSAALSSDVQAARPDFFGDGHASDRIADITLSLARDADPTPMHASAL